MASNFLRPLGVPCLLYIDDRHNGQLQVSLDKRQYDTLGSIDECNLAAAKSAVSLVQFLLDIATRDTIAMIKVLHAFKDRVKDCRIDVTIDNLAAMHSWNNQGGKGRDWNNAIEALFLPLWI